MLFFGHIGITAGIVKACDILVSKTKPDSSYQSDSNSRSGAVIAGEQLRLHYLLNRIKGRIGSNDYRIVLPASLLPDIIDKPVWFLVSSQASLSGRGYTHTLLFNLALLIGSLVLTRYRKPWLLIISLCSFVHLIFDQMWNNPVTLLWPLLGPLPKKETAGWWFKIFQELFSDPGVYVPEIIGLVIVLFFTYRLMMKKSVIGFLRDGAVG